jgi:hypothetical protein
MVQDPLVHRGHHFGRAIHAFCNIQILLMNAIVLLSENANDDDSLTATYVTTFLFEECNSLYYIPLEKGRSLVSSKNFCGQSQD